MTIWDKYKFAVKVLLENGFYTKSGEVLDKIEFLYTIMKNTRWQVVNWNHFFWINTRGVKIVWLTIYNHRLKSIWFYEIMNWAQTHHHISVHVFDSRHKKFISRNTLHVTKIVLCYIVKDHHWHPIQLLANWKKVEFEANPSECQKLIKE